MRKTLTGLTALTLGVTASIISGCTGVASKLGYVPKYYHSYALSQRDEAKNQVKLLSSNLAISNENLTIEKETVNNLQGIVENQGQEIQDLQVKSKYCVPITVNGRRFGWATPEGAKMYYNLLAEVKETKGESLTNLQQRALLLATDARDGKRDGILTDESIAEAYSNSANEILTKCEEFIETYFPSESQTESAGIPGADGLGDGIKPGEER